MHKPRITQRSRQKKRKSEKQKSRTKPQKQIQNKTQAKDMRRGSCCTWRASCVAASNKNKKIEARVIWEREGSVIGMQPTGKAKQLLAVWNGWNMVSCNAVHACGRQ